MKNICIIISSFYPIIGGSERQLQLIAEGLISKGYNVEIITRRYKGLSKEEYIGNIKINRIKVVQINKFTEKITFYINTILYLLLNVVKKPDVIIASQTGSAARIALFIKKVFKCKVLIRIAGGELKNFEEKIDKFKKLFKNVDKFIVLSEDMKSSMDVIGEKRIVKINNAVLKQDCINNELGKYVLFCGRIEEVKGIRLLLDSWREIEKSGLEISLVILGDGRLKREFEYKYSDLKLVKWIGEKKDTSIYYKNARMLINTSLYEGISNTILEALSYGIPVVAVDVGGNKDLICNHKNGLLINREGKDVTEAVSRLYFDKEKLKEMKKCALEYIENHNIEDIVDEYISQFN